jgi:hypothetical protein
MLEEKDIERLYKIIHFPQRIPMLQFLRDIAPSDVIDMEIFAQRKRMGVAVSDATNPEDVVNAVCTYYGMTYQRITEQDRKTEVKIPRMLGMIAVYYQCGYSLTATGHIFKRHHATVLHAQKAITNLIEVDSIMRQQVYECFKMLYQNGMCQPMMFFYNRLPEKFLHLYPRPTIDLETNEH